MRTGQSSHATSGARLSTFFLTLAVSVAAVCAAAGRGAAPQQSPPATPDLPASLERLRQWVAAVDQHEPGVADDSTQAFQQWPASQLLAVAPNLRELREKLGGRARSGGAPELPSVIHYRRPYGDLDVPLSSVQKALGLTDDELRRRDFNRLLLRGALLHADIAILRPAEQTFRPPLTPGQAAAVRVEVRDGRQEAIRPPSPHWDVGRDLLDAVTPRPSADPVVLLWYQATAAWLESEHSLAEAGQQLDHGIQLFPSDAALRFDRGWLYEFLAAPRVQSAVLALSLPRNVRVNVGSSRADLERAEEDFRKALEADPAFTEATVRLARVRALLGRHAEAIADLQEPARTARPALQYLANLFLGDAQQALGQRAAARQAYERAASLFPRAQSPLLALSRLAWLSGDRTGGVRAGRRVLGLETLDDFDDPWWQYFSPQGIDADRLLGELRAAITRGEKQ